MLPVLWLLPALPLLLLAAVLWRGLGADGTGWRHALPLAATPGTVATVVLAATTVPVLLVLGTTAALRPLLSPHNLTDLLLLDGLIIPVVEELGKAVAIVILALRGRLTSRRDALMLGLIAGIAFATIETYGHLWAARAEGAVTQPGDVLQIRLLLPPALHGCASGLLAHGWTAPLRARRIAFWSTLAIALHAAWNIALVAMEAATPHPAHLTVLLLPLGGALLWAVLWERSRPTGPTASPRGAA